MIQTTTATNPDISACTTVPASAGPVSYYGVYFSGCAKVESPTNPANSDPVAYPPITSILSGSLSACDAVRQCAQLTRNDPNVYYSFDLHFRISTGNWECVQYYDNNLDSSYFSVVDPDVRDAYGYGAYS